MPKQITQLTDTQVLKAKSRKKPYALFDGSGLYLLIGKTKLWRFKYTFNKKVRLVSFGKYPAVSLADARAKRNQFKELLEKGIDPATHRQSNTFAEVAERWQSKKSKWKESYAADVKRRLEIYVFPVIGHRDIATLEPKEILDMLRLIESRGLVRTAHMMKNLCGLVFRFAVGEGLCPRDPTADLKGLLETQDTRHNPAVIEPKQFGALLRAIDSYGGHYETRCALQLMPMLFVRTLELLHATWDEINFDEAVWMIPASRMKMKRDHVVPLSTQALSILTELKRLSTGEYVFQSTRTRKKPLSRCTLASALRAAGYPPEVQTVHGFRASARTLLDEQLHERFDLIEHQLAHAVRDATGRAYNRTQHLPERAAMMQRWADYLDTLKKEGLAII